jgi:hypothetical protein
MRYRAHRHHEPESKLRQYLEEGRRTLESAPQLVRATTGNGDAPLDVGPDFETLRWFWLPDEIRAELEGAPGVATDRQPEPAAPA